MSHGYSICFIDQMGKFQGFATIGSNARRDTINSIKDEFPSVFIGDFYEIPHGYAAIEVQVSLQTVNNLCNSVNIDDPLAQEMADSVEYALRKEYRMFLV